MHINPVGLLRIGGNNVERFFNFNILLNKIKNNGGNIAITKLSEDSLMRSVFGNPCNMGKIQNYLGFARSG
jgi:hypothetical protein